MNKILRLLILFLVWFSSGVALAQPVVWPTDFFTDEGQMITSNIQNQPARIAKGTVGQTLVVGSNGYPSFSSSGLSLTGLTVTGDLLVLGAGNGLIGASNASVVSLDADVTARTTAQPPVAGVSNASVASQAALVANGADSSGNEFFFFKTRAAVTATNANTIVNSGDVLFDIRGLGADGVDYQPGVRIVGTVDGTPGAGDLPGALTFYTTLDGAASPVSRLKIGNSGTLTIGQNTVTARVIDFGDAGVTPTQTLSILANTSDGDDDSALKLSGGGLAQASRGSFISLEGADLGGASQGRLQLGTGGGNATMDVAGTTIQTWSLTGATIAGQVTSTGLNFPAANFETVAGAGTTVADAAALSSTKHIHQITGANGTVGWKFASATAGQTEILLNTTAGVPKVYAVAGGTCNGGAADVACTLVTGIVAHVCYATASNAWICS